jgi:hypothetical protein
MNWEFHAVTEIDSVALLKKYRQLAMEGIKQWLETHVEPKEIQPETSYSEKPPGFFSKGPWYSFRTRVYGPGGCLDPAEYDVTVKQTFYPMFDQAIWNREMGKRIKIRNLKGEGPIS